MRDREQNSEEQALALLASAEVAVEMIQAIANDRGLRGNRKVCIAVVQHAKTPRRIALNFLRKLGALELMQIALTPLCPADIKRAAEDEIAKRLEGLSAGEKLTLARRGTGRMASTLVHDPGTRIAAAALDNRRLTESLILKAMDSENVSPELIGLLSKHADWSSRQEIQIALMRHPATSLARILEYAQRLPHPVLQEVVRTTRFEDNVRKYLERFVAGQATGN